MAGEGRVRVGLSGWDYDRWQGDFYPHGLRHGERLAYVSQRFDSVEVNGSFYALQTPTTYQRWYDATPPGFELALKGGRFITHLKRLREPHQSLANFFASGPLTLGEKLGPVLWQLPASLKFDPGVVAGFLDCLPASTGAASELAGHHDDKVHGARFSVEESRPIRHAIEVRDRSFDDPRFYDLLRAHDIACVASDSPTWPLLDVATAGHSYARLHGHSELYASGYSGRSLDRWAGWSSSAAEHGPVYVYFDNDARGRAPHNALGLRRRLDGHPG